MVNKYVKRLILEFLDEYSDRLGNDGCNDWEWPNWMPKDVRQEIWNFYLDDNDIQDDEDEKPDRKFGPNNVSVVEYLIDEIKREL